MALRLIRNESDEPNVTNVDDARMVRYAYGGKDGIVKGMGAECSHAISGSIFQIKSGVITLHGWEAEVDAAGWSMNVDTVQTKRYYAVYYEVNRSVGGGGAQIASQYSLSGYPVVNVGDDLTTVVNGTARLLLYNFTAQSGVIAEVQRRAEIIQYSSVALNELSVDTKELKSKFNRLKNEESGIGHDGFIVDKIGMYSVCVRYDGKSHHFIIEIPNLMRDAVGPVYQDEQGYNVYAYYRGASKSIYVMTEGEYSKESIRLIISYEV